MENKESSEQIKIQLLKLMCELTPGAIQELKDQGKLEKIKLMEQAAKLAKQIIEKGK